MKCLAKDADDRPQRATDIVRVLETVTSSAGARGDADDPRERPRHVQSAMLVYVVAFAIVAVVAKAAIVAVGLPDWVFPRRAGDHGAWGSRHPVHGVRAPHGAARDERDADVHAGRYAEPAQGTMAQLAIKASPHVSWRRAWIGGAAAVAGFVLLVGAYMVLRALGIGPAGSLLAAGAIDKDEKILVADLASPANDSTLGPVVTDAFRTALGQSQSVCRGAADDRARRAPPHGAAGRPSRRLRPRARDRHAEGIKAVIDGSLLGVGGRYVIALRLVSAQTGDELATFRETAKDQSEILPVVDRLAKEVRAKIGESLRTVQGAPPLEQVTTPSLEALREVRPGAAHDRRWATSRGHRDARRRRSRSTRASRWRIASSAVEYGNRGITEKAQAILRQGVRAHRPAERRRAVSAPRQLLPAGRIRSSEGAVPPIERCSRSSRTTRRRSTTSSTPDVHAPARRARSHCWCERSQVGPVATVHYRNLRGPASRMGARDSAWPAAHACSKAFPKNLDCQTDHVGTCSGRSGRIDSRPRRAALRTIERPRRPRTRVERFGEAELSECTEGWPTRGASTRRGELARRQAQRRRMFSRWR
jgi:hypothetical protein